MVVPLNVPRLSLPTSSPIVKFLRMERKLAAGSDLIHILPGNM